MPALAIPDGGGEHVGQRQLGNGTGAVGRAVEGGIVVDDDMTIARGMHIELDLFEIHSGCGDKSRWRAVAEFERAAAMRSNTGQNISFCSPGYLTAPMVMPRTRCFSTRTKPTITGSIEMVDAAMTSGQSMAPSPGLIR